MQNRSTASGIKPLVAACLLTCASLGAQAATVNFYGVTDSGPHLGQTFSGNFSFADPVAPDAIIDLDAFSLEFMGVAYTLADADFGLTPVAYFTAGEFLGVDYFSNSSVLPSVALSAGFSSLSEAFFSYRVNGSGGPEMGFGTLVDCPFRLGLRSFGADNLFRVPAL